MKPENIINKRYGRLVVISFDKTKHNKGYYNCLCDCDTVKSIDRSSLKSGATKSCGCLNKEKVKENKIKDITGRTFGQQ